MIRVFVLLMFVVIANATFAQPDTSNCSSFKSGHFTFTNDSGQLVHMKRSGRMQRETVPATGVVTRLRVKWVADCAYELTQVWSSSKALRKQTGGTTLIQIIQTAKYSYEYTSSCGGAGAGTRSGTVNKVRR